MHPLRLAIALVIAGCRKDTPVTAPTDPPAVTAALHTDASLDAILTAMPGGATESAREAIRNFFYCVAAIQPAACARLTGDDRGFCREASAQVAARAAGAKHWFGVSEGIDACAAHGPREECVTFARAVEESAPAACSGLSQTFADCAAIAAGDPTRCPTSDLGSSCVRAVREVIALRKGLDALTALPGGPMRAVAIGRVHGVSECERGLRRALPR